jgi:hypothetical protein
MIRTVAVAALALLAAASQDSPLAQEAERQLAAMRASTYSHKTQVDEAKGVFNYDCSGFVGLILEKVAPEAGKAIRHKGHKRPLAADFVSLFATLPSAGWGRWLPVGKAQDLQPGDLIAWLKPPKNKGTDTGHVMVVRRPPTVNPERVDEYLVVIIDATSSPHAQDTRKAGASGLPSRSTMRPMVPLPRPFAPALRVS